MTLEKLLRHTVTLCDFIWGALEKNIYLLTSTYSSITKQHHLVLSTRR